MRRRKPMQDHRRVVPIPESVEARVIGVVHSPYTERFGTPRQPPVTEQVLDERAHDATIELFDQPGAHEALQDVAGFDYVWVISWLHLNHGWSPLVTPPRGPRRKRGLFSTRAPHRPNPLGLSALRLLRVHDRTLHVHGIDLLDGTPVLDVKPYVPYTDARPNARAGWLDELEEPLAGPDRWE